MKLKRKKLSIVLIFVLTAGGACYFFILNPERVDFFGDDCNTFEGTLFNNSEKGYRGLVVTVYYKTGGSGRWLKKKKYFRGTLMPGQRAGFRLCGEELAKIEEYYLELKKEKITEFY